MLSQAKEVSRKDATFNNGKLAGSQVPTWEPTHILMFSKLVGAI